MNNLIVILIFSLLFFNSCNQKKKGSSPPGYNVGPEFSMYVNSFKEKMNLAGINKSTQYLQAGFTDTLPPGAVGVCQLKTINDGSTTYKVPVIKFLRVYWDNLDDSEKEQITYHELAHCILGRAHSIQKDGGNNPVSIMYTSLIPGAAYRSQYGEFMSELFNTNKQEFIDMEFQDY
jgi:hypothetical protein